MNRYNKLNNKIEEVPKIIQISSKNSKEHLNTQKQQNIKNNSLIELLFRTTFLGRIKRIFGTYKGTKNKTKLNNIRWFERQAFPKYTKN